jgi:small subunit ribosomal protein S5
MVNVKLKGDTIPHDVLGRIRRRPSVLAQARLARHRPRSPAAACAPCSRRPGVKNVLTKSMGSSNHIAVVHATLNGLLQLRLAEDIAARPQDRAELYIH